MFPTDMARDPAWTSATRTTVVKRVDAVTLFGSRRGSLNAELLTWHGCFRLHPQLGVELFGQRKAGCFLSVDRQEPGRAPDSLQVAQQGALSAVGGKVEPSDFGLHR